MILHIKYMVSLRCKMLVKSELEKLGLSCLPVELGSAEIRENISKEQLEQFRKALNKAGLELLDGKKTYSWSESKASLSKWFTMQMKFQM